MLLNEDERSPLKAIDFGLAVSFDPEQLPRSDIGLEGTPWSVSPNFVLAKLPLLGLSVRSCCECSCDALK